MGLQLRSLRTLSSYLPFVYAALCIFLISRLNADALQIRFNPYALLALAGAIGNGALLATFYRLKTKTSSTLVFSLFLVTLTVSSGAETLQRASVLPSGAIFWSTVGTASGVLMPLFFLAFVLVFLRKDSVLRSMDFIFIACAGIAAVMYIGVTPDLAFNADPARMVLEPWGYTNPRYGYFFIYALWLYALFTIAGALLLLRYLASHRESERRQLGIILAALLVPLVSTVTDMILPALGYNVLGMGTFVLSFTAALIAYAMLKYNLFIFNPAAVASNILETMQEAVIVLNPALTVEYANHMVGTVLGRSESDMVGEPISRYLATEFGTFKTRLIDPLRRQAVAHAEKMALVDADHRTVPVSMSSTRIADESGKTGAYILVATDISKLEESYARLQEKVAEVEKQNVALEELGSQLQEEKASVERKVEERTREVQESRAQLLASINNLQFGFIMTDTQLNVLMLNAAAREFLRANGGPSDTDVLIARLDDTLGIDASIRKSIASRGPIEIKDLAVGDRVYHVFVSPILLEGAIIGSVVLVQDVTEAKILERSKDEFFSIAAHELRTPIAAIRGYASMIKEEYEQRINEEKFTTWVERVNQGGAQLNGIVRTFLNTSLLEQGKISFSIESFPLKPLLEEACSAMQGILAEKHLTLTLDGAGTGLPKVRGDKERVKEVVNNLIGNAAKFTEYGGVLVRVVQDGAYLKVSVQDSGKGIPFENQKLLFRKYQQAGDMFTRDSSLSTGLGLYISRLMLEGMGGSIWLEESKVGKGSTFSFKLPLT